MRTLRYYNALFILVTIIACLWLGSAHAYDCVLDINGDGIADGTSGANSQSIPSRLACGNSASAEDRDTVALGMLSRAAGISSTALGFNARAIGDGSIALGRATSSPGHIATALGAFSIAAGENSVVLGRTAETYPNAEGSVALGAFSEASKDKATSVGNHADSHSKGAVSLGFASGFRFGSSYAHQSPYAIAIGYHAKIMENSLGAIAIGGGFGDYAEVIRGASADGEKAIAIGHRSRANKPGAIALGADVVADTANTMQVGVPIRIERGDGTSQLRVTETSTGKNVRTLMSLKCEHCTPGFRISRALPANDTWFFRMLQNGNFSVDDPATIAKEAEFRSGGDLKIGGTLIQASSRDIKNNIVEVDTASVLVKLEALPIHHWTYNHNPDQVRHMGPMAEDFYKAFGLGDTDKGIAGVDTSGVALAAIKALNAEKDAQIEMLNERIENLEIMVAQLIHKEKI